MTEISNFENLHRSACSTLFWMTLLFSFMFGSWIGSLVSSSLLVVIVPFVIILSFSLVIWSSFKRRSAWAFQLAKVLWYLCMFGCGLIFIIDMLAAAQGDIFAGVLAVMLLYVGYNMAKRAPMFNNPLFQSWYLGTPTNQQFEFQLADQEVMAACPNCMSLLAVRPLDLTPDQLCPNCNGRLISDETEARFAGEEE